MNSNLKENILSSKSSCIYGLGTTGKSVVNFIRRKSDFKYYVWDDYLKSKKKIKKKNFAKKLDTVDFIVISPGISLKKAKLKRELIRNKHKIITDIDLFYLFNPKVKTVVVTGTNGKSTTCKILQHVLKKNKFKVELGGNIGNPVLNLKIKNKPIVEQVKINVVAYKKNNLPKHIKKIPISIPGSRNLK